MKTASHTYYLPSGTRNKKATAYANALAIELIPYGISLSDNLFNRIASSREEIAAEFCQDVLKEYTVGKLNKPLFKNWEQRKYFSLNEVVIQICGYIFQVSGNDLEDPSYMKKLLRKVKYKKEKTLELASIEDAQKKFQELTETQVSQDKKNQKNLEKAALYFSDLVGQQYIKSDEARVAVLKGLSSQENLSKCLKTLKCKPSDTLRFAAAMKNFETVKLPSTTLYSNLNWQNRINLFSFLNSFSFDDLSEAMGQNRECWTRFFKHFHLFSQKNIINRFPTLGLAARISLGFKQDQIPKQYKKIFTQFVQEGIVETLDSGNTVYRTFASRVNSAIEKKDYSRIESLFEKNGGYLLRNLATVANGITRPNEGKFIQLVRSKLSKASPGVLFSILGINVDAKYRIIDAKGTTSINEAKYPKVILDIQGDIRREIYNRWGYKGKVEVTDILRDKVVPFLAKNSDLNRGDKIAIENTNYLYFFCHWIQPNNHRTDLDTSYVAFDKNWHPFVTYFGNQVKSYVVHSGDITNAPAPNGATEYGRISLKEIPKDVHYIVPIINVFAGKPLSENAEAYAGFQFSNEGKFRIERKHTRYDLSQPANSNIPFVLDVVNQQIIVLDFNNNIRSGFTAHSEINNMKKLISAAEDKYFITMGILAEMLSGEGEEISLKICKNPAHDKEIDPDSLSKLFVDGQV